MTAIAPALEAVEYIELDFSDAFNSTSKYRGPPTKELEDAWEDLTFSKRDFSSIRTIETDVFVEHAVEIPLDKLHFANRTEADHMKKVPPEVGTGYVALIEVFHQLHCLVSAFTTFFS